MTVPLFGAPQEEATSDDYYTPSWLFEDMGIRFDVDVAAPPGGVPWVPADRFFTKADDGLAQEWVGRVWMNPPYSNSTPWVRKFVAHANGVALVPWAKSAWTIEAWQSGGAIALPGRWFNFGGGSIMLPVFFLAFGDECVEAIGRVGHVR